MLTRNPADETSRRSPGSEANMSKKLSDLPTYDKMGRSTAGHQRKRPLSISRRTAPKAMWWSRVKPRLNLRRNPEEIEAQDWMPKMYKLDRPEHGEAIRPRELPAAEAPTIR